MKERPILFNGEMVRAILDGRKTQTRRIIKGAPIGGDGPYEHAFMPGAIGCTGVCAIKDPKKGFIKLKSPFGKMGDHLWVRESFQPILAEGIDYKDSDWETAKGYEPIYVATQSPVDFVDLHDDISSRVTPSIHMPRQFSRITLEITNVRVERLQDITEEDAKNEGVEMESAEDDSCPSDLGNGYFTPKSYSCGFMRTWDSIYQNWNKNPWVWVVEFKVVKS